MRSRFRRLAAPFALLALIIAAAPAQAGLDIEDAVALPWRSEGKLLFYLDAASFPAAEGPGRTEFYLRVPGDELAFVDGDSGRIESARLSYELKIKNQNGKTVLRQEREVRVPPEEPAGENFSLGHVFLLQAALEPGWYEAEIKLRDLNTQKRGLVYVGRKSHFEGKVKGIFRVADPRRGGGLAVSDLEPAWSVDRQRGAGGPFARGSVQVIPNPSRTYGLYQTQAAAYYEVLAPGRDGELMEARARVADLKGRVVLEARPETLVTAERTWGQVRFDVSPLPSGAYDVTLTLVAADGSSVERRSRINVAWQPHTWRGDARSLLDEVHFLLDDPDQEDLFAVLTPGEQEAFLDHYWKRRDPDPATARNEEREKFYERVRYANERFGTAGFERGMFTDRGRIYIRYGAPDEIRQEVLPTHGLQVDDIAREVAAREGPSRASSLRGRGNIGADLRSFEIWTYDRLLAPSSDEARDSGPRRPLRRLYVFVDEEGYGNYMLRYSNE